MNPQGNRNANYTHSVGPYFQPPMRTIIDNVTMIDNMTMNFQHPGNYSVLMDFNPSPDALRNAQMQSQSRTTTDLERAVVVQGQRVRQYQNGPTVTTSTGTQCPPLSPSTARVLAEERNINGSNDVVRTRLSQDGTGSRMTSPSPPSRLSPLVRNPSGQ